MKNTIAIVGSHPRTREQFDFSRTDCEVWMFNEVIGSAGNEWAKRADAVFQMHVPPIWRNPNNRNDPRHYEWLKTQTETPTIFMQDNYADIPAAVNYPLDAIRAMLGNNKDHFLSSSVAYAIALAIYQGYKRIEVYGVAMETDTEYRFQREGVAFWRGFAMGRGIEFYFADNTFETLLYGYEGEVVIDYSKFDERIAQLQPEAQKVEAEYVAKKIELNNALETFCTTSTHEAEKELFAQVESLKKYADVLGLLDGAMQENAKYKAKADAMKETNGEFIFSRQEFDSAVGTLRNASQQADTDITIIGTELNMIHGSVKSAAKNSPKYNRMTQDYRAHLVRFMAAVNKAGLYRGAVNENMNYMAILDKSIRAAGGEKSEAVMLESMRRHA